MKVGMEMGKWMGKHYSSGNGSTVVNGTEKYLEIIMFFRIFLLCETEIRNRTVLLALQ